MERRSYRGKGEVFKYGYKVQIRGIREGVVGFILRSHGNKKVDHIIYKILTSERLCLLPVI